MKNTRVFHVKKKKILAFSFIFPAFRIQQYKTSSIYIVFRCSTTLPLVIDTCNMTRVCVHVIQNNYNRLRVY